MGFRGGGFPIIRDVNSIWSLVAGDFQVGRWGRESAGWVCAEVLGGPSGYSFGNAERGSYWFVNLYFENTVGDWTLFINVVREEEELLENAVLLANLLLYAKKNYS